MGRALTKKRIALAEARELDLLAGMLEREGADVLRRPLVAIKDVADADPVVAWLRRAVAQPYDDVIFYTGEGVRRLMGFADRSGIREEFLSALKNMRKITRGSKPVKALRELGLSPDLSAEIPTTAGLMALLDQGTLHGRTMGLQIYGQEANTQLLAFLQDRGAVVDVVAPYVYASEADDKAVQDFIHEMAAGAVDAMAFTSSPQVRRLVDVAKKYDLMGKLKDGMGRIKIAAVGPVVAQELERQGIRVDAMPVHAYTMKPLVKAIARLFTLPL